MIGLKLKAFAALVFAALLGTLYWQITKNGELSAVNTQLAQDVEDSQQQIADITARRAQDNQQIAEARNRYEKINRKANQLQQQIRNSKDGCATSFIDKSVVDRVREYRSENGSGSRTGTGSMGSTH